MTTPLNRSRRGPLLVLVIAFIALLALPVVLATVGADEEHDVAGAAGTTTEVPTTREVTTTSEATTTTSESTTTTAPVPETTTTTVDMSAVYAYAAALEQAKQQSTTTTTAPPPVVEYVEYVEVPVVEAAPEPVYEEPVAEPVYEEPVVVDGDPFAGLSWSDRQFLECIKHRESRGDYTAVNPQSGAGGAYQFLQNTWNNTAAHVGRSDLIGLPPQYATPYDQDYLAAQLLLWYGRSPWSYSC